PLLAGPASGRLCADPRPGRYLLDSEVAGQNRPHRRQRLRHVRPLTGHGGPSRAAGYGTGDRFRKREDQSAALVEVPWTSAAVRRLNPARDWMARNASTSRAAWSDRFASRRARMAEATDSHFRPSLWIIRVVTLPTVGATGPASSPGRVPDCGSAGGSA